MKIENNACFFAVDLGATSGRTIIGRLSDGSVKLEELTRFPNTIIRANGHCYWDFPALYQEIIKGLSLAARRGENIKSIGIDTWGVDFILTGSDGMPMRSPLCYRDPASIPAMDKYFEEVMPREEVYGRTGIQLMNFNSLFQLYGMRGNNDAALKCAEKVLFLPDALAYMLTGKMVCERTIASTSQMLNPKTGTWDEDLLASVGLTPQHFAPIVEPGTKVGELTEELQQITGLGAVPVVAVAGHDTGCAIAAVPAANERFAYLSSGTWSLMGVELNEPVITPETYAMNFTNEAGAGGTTTFLKNICGLWLYESCRREWTDRHNSHAELQAEVAKAEPFRSLIDPDDAMFTNPKSMPEAIKSYCKKTGQPVPETRGEICRCIFESLAMRYRQVMDDLRKLGGQPIETLHIIGGGSLNAVINQAAANACGVRVIAGPQEATALGNILLQAQATGLVNGLAGIRKIAAASVETTAFEPHDTALWNTHYERFKTILAARLNS